MKCVKVRPAVLNDAKGICEINQTSLGYDYPLEKTAERMNLVLDLPSHRLYVAELDGFVVGYIHGCDYECVYSDSMKDVLALAVDSADQGRRVGRALLEELEAWARSCGCAGVRLESGFEREGAHRFYMRLGYALRKDHKNFAKPFAR